jgi:non-specific serine/threonine protein kinase
MSQFAESPGLDSFPVELTSFVGRDQDIQAASARLANARLMTLTGTGGCGKTRLACHVARRTSHAYESGAWFVELGELSEPRLVPDAIAQVLGLNEPIPDESIPSALLTALRRRHLLLVLDNCEHLLEASAAFVDVLLRACPHVHVLATSRQSLGLVGEVTLRVPSLELPPHDSGPTAAQLGGIESVRLFVERACARSPAFVLNDQNAAAVAAICRRLDGIPLALELAAAWMRVLSPSQLAERLDGQFELLIGAYPSVPRRHQTLRALIDWSYDLLSDAERVLLRRLSVFAGGWQLEAAEAICALLSATSQAPGVLEVLTGLVDKSVVQVEPSLTADGASRYRLLEPLREYARERLRRSGEETSMLERHRGWFLALATQAEASWRGPDQTSWLARLDQELDNLRAALAWTRARTTNTAAGKPLTQEHEIRQGLRLASALWWFWLVRGHLAEGREHVRTLLQIAEASGLPPSAEQARALQAAGRLAQVQGHLAEARALLEASLAMQQANKQRHERADVLHDLGLIAHAEGDLTRADALQREVLELTRGQNDQVRVYRSLYHLGEVAADLGQHERAELLFEEALDKARAAGDMRGIAIAAADLGGVLRSAGETERAASLYAESVRLLSDLGDRRRLGSSLLGLATVALDSGDVDHSARLGGIAEHLASAVAASPLPGWLAARDQLRSALEAASDPALVAAAWANGSSLEPAEAMAVARSARPGPANTHRAGAESASDWRSRLSTREREVALLVAAGYSNPRIAEQLVITRRTADTHVQNILTKLGLHSRAQVAAWVVQRQNLSGVHVDPTSRT